jgi:peptidoglycan/LPS O-acetylase OafA/YrhL
MHSAERAPSVGPGRIAAPCSYEAYRRTGFFGSLDGLRCLSILAVIWVHTGIRTDDFELARNGHLGVDLFFAISGFLITTLLLREKDRWGSISLGAFYIRRALRIFPLYYTVVGIYAVAVLTLEPDTETGRQFLANLPFFLTYTSNWFVPLEGRVIFYFAWSLATEEQFYLVWPTAEKLLRGWNAVWLVAGILVLREAVQFAVQSGGLDGDHLAVKIFLSIHPAILGGVVLAHVLHHRRTFERAAWVLGSRAAAPAALVALLASIELSVPIDMVRALMVLLVGAVAIRESNGLSRILTWRPVVHIGTVSYGMYLLHMLSYNASRRALEAAGFHQEWLWFPVTVAVATLAATLSYRYYESWFLRQKDRFSRLAPAQPPVGSSAPRRTASDAGAIVGGTMAPLISEDSRPR